MSEFDQVFDGKVGKIVKGKGKWIVIGIAALVILIIFLTQVMYTVNEGKVGIIWSKFGVSPKVENRFIVEKGEKGYLREVLMPGIHWYLALQPMWKYKIEQVPFIDIKQGQVGIVEALDGTPMPEGQILAKEDWVDKSGKFHMGEKGPRLTVLTPGRHPINTQYLKVMSVPTVQIPEGKFGVMIRKYGVEPPAGTILVPRDLVSDPADSTKKTIYAGIVKEILVPKTYYFNPTAVKIEQHPAIVIKKGEVGVVTKKVGTIPPAGTILVSATDEFQGIQRELLQPGMYYINPYEKEVKVIPAIVVPDGAVGVQIAKTGETKPTDQLLAKSGERGILENVLSPGIYYVNPFEFEVVMVDIRQQRYEMTSVQGEGDTEKSDAIQFLSNDGFIIEIDLTILYQVLPHNAPYAVATIGRDVKSVMDKVIRPHSRSYARIQGSMKKGEDFVHGETRKLFQEALFLDLKLKAGESNIQINQALVRHFEVPQELRDPITRKVIAEKVKLQYVQEQEREKENAKLAREKELVNFESKKVMAETQKVKAIIQAQEQRDVEEINKKKKVFIAQGDAEQKKIGADAALYFAEKEAAGLFAKKKAEADGQKVLVAAWGQPGAENLVKNRYAEVLTGAKILPLEYFFGGSGKGGGQGNFLYGNVLDVFKFVAAQGMEKEKAAKEGAKD